MRFDIDIIMKRVAVLVVVVVSIFFMTSLIIAIPYNRSADNEIEKPEVEEVGDVEEIAQKDDHTAEDHVEKNKLLHSSETDYSAPDKNVPLQLQDYVVKKGDTLSGLAKEFGVSIDTICGNSGLTSYDMISVGRKLRIPNKEGIMHTMKKGERLMNVATRYAISIDKIILENPEVHPDFVSSGTNVFIPDAKPQNIMPGWLWPVATKQVTSRYGMRVHPVSGNYIMHKGLDIRARYQWVRATRYGRVTYTGWLGGYGKVVVIAHPGGYKTLYGHLSKIIVRNGQYVKQGQSIAKSGNTGVSTGPHLHFEVQKNGVNVNPRKFIK